MTQARAQLVNVLFQKEVTYKTPPAPAAKQLFFTKIDMQRDARMQKNLSITSNPMGNKSDAGNPVPKAAPFTIPMDLRAVGNLLRLALGAPVVTGVGPYTHTFPLNLADRPSALVEIGHTDISKYFRFLGVKCNKLAWDIMSNDQNMTGELIPSVEVDPVPATAFDAAPTSYTSFRASAAGGTITDGAGTTLGTVVSGTVAINNNMKAMELVDGNAGYSLIDQGELDISGKIKVVFDGLSAYALARAQTGTRLKMVTQATIGALTCSLTVDLTTVELTELRPAVEGKSGFFVELGWNSYGSGGSIALLNDVASY
jgi:hypothetical protein